MHRFCEKAKEKFEIEKNEEYNDSVWASHQRALADTEKGYDADIHYPLLLTLTRKKKKVIAPPAWAMSHGGGCKCCKGKRMPMW